MAANAELIAELKAKLKARENKPGMGANVAAIQKRIAELEAASGD
jgi:hypothetical protein